MKDNNKGKHMGSNGPTPPNSNPDLDLSDPTPKQPKEKSLTRQKQSGINDKFKSNVHKIGKSAQGIAKGNWDPHHAGKAVAEAIMDMIKLLLEMLKLLSKSLMNLHHHGLDKQQRAKKKIDDTHPGLEKDIKHYKGQIENLQEKLDFGKGSDGNQIGDEAKQQLKDSQKEKLKQVHKHEKRMEKDRWKEKLATPKMAKEQATNRYKAGMEACKTKPCLENTENLKLLKDQYKAAKKTVKSMEKQRDVALEQLKERQKLEMTSLDKGEYKPSHQLHQAISDKKDKVNEAQESCDKIQQKLDGKDLEVKSVEKDLRVATKAFEDKRAELDQLDSPSQEQKHGLKQLEDTKNQAQKKLDDLKPEHDKLSKEFESAKDGLKQAKEGLENSKNALKQFNDLKYDGLEAKQRQHHEKQDQNLFDASKKVEDYQSKIDSAKEDHEKLLKSHMDGPTQDTEKAVKDNDKKIKGLETGFDKAKNDLSDMKEKMFDLKANPIKEEDLDLGNLFDESSLDKVNPLQTPTPLQTVTSSENLTANPQDLMSQDQPKTFQDLVENVTPLTKQLSVIQMDQQQLTGTQISGQTFQQSGISSHVPDLNMDSLNDTMTGQQTVPTHLKEDSDVHNVSDGLQGGKSNPQITVGPPTDLTLDPMHQTSQDEREKSSLRQESKLGLSLDGPTPSKDPSKDMESTMGGPTSRLR